MNEKDRWWLAAEIYTNLLVGYTLSTAILILVYGSKIDSMTLYAWNNQNIAQVMASFITVLTLGAPGIWLTAILFNLKELKQDAIEIYKAFKKWWDSR